MNLTIDREILLENLNTVSRGLPNRSPMPIRTGIKLYATDTDLFMTSSNSNISVEVDINDKSLVIAQPGQTVVPGKFFIEIIRKINSKSVNLYISDDKVLVIKADRGEYKLHVMDPFDYPKIDFITLENPLSIDASEIKAFIRETIFATATNEKKPILTGVNLKNTAGKLVVSATDSFRVSQKIVDIDPQYKDFNITLPNKSLEELVKAIDQYPGKVSLYFSSNNLLFAYKNVMFQTRLLDGNYPDTSRFFPAEFQTTLKFNKDELMEAVSRVSLLSPDSSFSSSIVILSLKKDRVIEILTYNPNIGDAKEELIPTDIETTKPIQIGFSSIYLVDALKNFMSTEISLNISGEIRPFTITGDRDPNLIQLILPVNI